MKICYLADGESVHTKRWCAHFLALGHEVHLISFKNVQIEGVKVHHLDAGTISVKGGNWKVLLTRKKIRKLLSEIKPDLLHAQYATSYGLVGALSGFHPYIVTALGSDVLISPQRSMIYRKLVRFVFKRADWITAMAEHMRETILKLGVPPKKVATVIFGIDPLIFNSEGRNVPPDRFVITSTRNFEPVYNLELLVNALNLVKDKIPGLTVNLIGEGTQRQHIEEMIAKAGLKDKTRFFGKVPQTEIATVLRTSHVCVSTSLSDGNNVSLNEAMACGAVSLATDIPANRQWINNNVNGFLVPTSDAAILSEKILYVYNNYPALQRSSNSFNEKIIKEKALWSENMKIVADKYRELTNKK